MVKFVVTSMTRLGDLLHFGQLFKACGNNYFAQITHILGNFCRGVKNFHFSSRIILGNFYRHWAIFYWSHCRDHYFCNRNWNRKMYFRRGKRWRQIKPTNLLTFFFNYPKFYWQGKVKLLWQWYRETLTLLYKILSVRGWLGRNVTQTQRLKFRMFLYTLFRGFHVQSFFWTSSRIKFILPTLRSS